MSIRYHKESYFSRVNVVQTNKTVIVQTTDLHTRRMICVDIPLGLCYDKYVGRPVTRPPIFMHIVGGGVLDAPLSSVKWVVGRHQQALRFCIVLRFAFVTARGVEDAAPYNGLSLLQINQQHRNVRRADTGDSSGLADGINNVVRVSGEQWRDSAIHIHVSILPQLPSHPGCHITVSRYPLCYKVGP